jgi:hypothetical protein
MKKIINASLIIVTITFIIYFLFKHFDYNTILNIKFNYWYLLISFIILSFHLLFQSFIWSILIKILNPSISISMSIKYWVLSQYGKYLPGKVGVYAILFYLYKDSGISKKDLSVASYYELVGALVAILYVSVSQLLFINKDIFSHLELMLIFGSTLSLTIMLHPKLLNMFLRIVSKILQKDNFEVNLDFKTILKITTLYYINFFVLGIAFYLFICSIVTLEIYNLSYIILAMNLSGFFGLIIFFMPAGFGAREGALIYFLKKTIDFQVATAISIISRVWIIIAELFTLGITYIYLKFYGHIDVLGIINKSKEEVEN